MDTLKALLLPLFAVITLFFSVTTVLARGGPVEFSVYPSSQLNPGEQYVVHAKVSVEDEKHNIVPCKACHIKLAFYNPQESDYLAQSSDITDDEGRIYAKVNSKIPGKRTIYLSELKDLEIMPMSSFVILNYTGDTATINTQAPEMIYPQNNQILDLEGAYMFKVKAVHGASGYLFGLFQNNMMVYENYRDAGVLSANGEFALWDSNPAHNKFKTGEVKVMIRAMVNNQWTDAREITIHLKPRGGTQKVVSTVVDNSPESPAVKAKLPVIQPSKTVVIVNDSSASAQLQKKVEELEQKLVASQEKQSALETRLNQLISWIKSIFPFFN